MVVGIYIFPIFELMVVLVAEIQPLDCYFEIYFGSPSNVDQVMLGRLLQYRTSFSTTWMVCTLSKSVITMGYKGHTG